MGIKNLLKLGFAIFFPIFFLVFLVLTNQPGAIPTPPPTVPTINITLPDDISTADFDLNPKQVIYNIDTLTLISDNTTFTYDNLELKGRGNSTWGDPKKPFQIKFSDKTDFLGLGKEKKFILLADAFDPSHLKNTTAFYLEHMLEQNYAISSHYANLYFNDEFYGLYLVAEKVELGKHRIHLSNQSAILVEHEGLHAASEEHCYASLYSRCLIVKDLNEASLEQSAIDDFLAKYIDFERAAADGNYNKVTELVDIDSFAKYYLLSNFTLNPDAFMSSYFFYQDGPDDKIHVGPGWDFDLAFSDKPTLQHGISFFAPYSSIPTGSESPTIYHLLKIPAFKQRVKELYLEHLYGRSLEMFNFINNTIDYIHDSAATDNEKWDLRDFDDAVDSFKDWLRDRYDYLDAYYSSRPDPDASQIIEL